MAESRASAARVGSITQAKANNSWGRCEVCCHKRDISIPSCKGHISDGVYVLFLVGEDVVEVKMLAEAEKEREV